MDQPKSVREGDDPAVVVTPEIRYAPQPFTEKRRSVLPLALGVGGVLFGLGALGISGWNYLESRRELLRLASEIAQLRVSLDLYARNTAQAAAPTAAAADDSVLADLADRLAILEQNSIVQAPAAAAPLAAPATASSDNEDCLPSGMRLLVAAGDNYPICGQPAAVEVSQVDNGFIVLSDGTAVASGGTMPLPGSSCTIGVTSSGDEGLTGYAEIRVTC